MPNRTPRQGGGRPEPEPKPFGKVIIARPKSQRAITKHDKFVPDAYTGRLTCTLTALTPIHIGSGIYELEGENPVRGVITADDKTIVPGTSLKGAIRSIAEAISDSCVRITKKDIEKNLAVRDARPCDELKSKHRQSGGEKTRDPRLCVCCSIFGALGYQGRVSFSDARLVKGSLAVHQIQSPYPPRESARIYKDARGQFNGRKFYYHGEPLTSQRGEPYHIITKDSQLEFTMSFESVTAQELCLVLVAMGIFDEMVIKIGGGKQAMLGSVKVTPTKLELQATETSFSDFSAGARVIEADVVKYLFDQVGSASTLINETALDELIRIWEWPSSRRAPTGVY
ncbi:MAG: RAMP superfamily CRISPR-associated protein [Acidobacteriota bacterium]|nr:RAMP superfamily CRISPR-associated protein [Blastocatellia bacterium]MDW8241517.1 RAMP superfamily CRISPR-associated protein [Acidobacteriota bacterium]